MTVLEVFGWRKLNPASTISYSFDGTSIFLKKDGGGEPLPTKMLSAWVETPDGWLLRTLGRPSTVGRVEIAYGDLSDRISKKVPMDPRILIVQTACEATSSSTDPSGKDARSPRTEVGYPGRTGESDPGDVLRDQVDWERSGGKHSSHGLTQCLIETAVANRPDLFKGVSPRFYRTILWKPENAFLCLAAAYSKMRPEWASDVVKLRVAFGAGGVYPSSKNVFGARMYAPSVLTRWIAYWNDLAAYLADPSDLGPPQKTPPKKPPSTAAATSGGWVLPVGLAVGALALLTRGGGT